MDLIARVAKHFEDSAHTKLDAIEIMAAPIAAAIETLAAMLDEAKAEIARLLQAN